MPSKSIYCINPQCTQPDHPNSNDPNVRYCQSCGSELLLNGEFRVSRLLNNNTGFGIVYEVFKGFSPYILKVLQPNWNNDAKAVELFKREYEVLAELTTKGITGIPQAEAFFEYQTKEGLNLYCLVMEKIEGIDLGEWLKQNEKLKDQKQAIKWLREIILILDQVHNKNWFHRDIKPSNIMIRNNGELVLIDFGTAREETQTYYQKAQGQQVTGIVTAGYTPPEQQNGQAVAQSDFYALGRTFVHLLTGKLPLQMYDAMKDDLIWQFETENINLLLLNFLDRLMAKSANSRPANTKIIIDQLDKIEKAINAPPPTKVINKKQVSKTSATTVKQPSIKKKQFNKSKAIKITFISLVVTIVGFLSVAIPYTTYTGKLYNQINDLRSTIWDINDSNEKIQLLNKQLFLYKKLLNFYQQTFNVWGQNEVNVDIMFTYYSLGEEYRKQGKTTDALDSYKKYLDMSKSNSTTSTWDYEAKESTQAGALASLGSLYFDLGELEKSLDYYLESYSIDNNNHRLAVTVWQIAQIYDDLGDGEKALDYYNKSLSFDRLLQRKENEAFTLLAIGILYNNYYKDYTKTLENYNQSLAIFKQLGDKKMEAKLLTNIGVAYGNNKQDEKAIFYLDQALIMSRGLKDKKLELDVLYSLGNQYLSKAVESMPDRNKVLFYRNKAVSYFYQALSIARGLKDREKEAEILEIISKIS